MTKSRETAGADFLSCLLLWQTLRRHLNQKCHLTSNNAHFSQIAFLFFQMQFSQTCMWKNTVFSPSRELIQWRIKADKSLRWYTRGRETGKKLKQGETRAGVRQQTEVGRVQIVSLAPLAIFSLPRVYFTYFSLRPHKQTEQLVACMCLCTCMDVVHGSKRQWCSELCGHRHTYNVMHVLLDSLTQTQNLISHNTLIWFIFSYQNTHEKSVNAVNKRAWDVEPSFSFSICQGWGVLQQRARRGGDRKGKREREGEG